MSHTHTPSITVTYIEDDRYTDGNQRWMWGKDFLESQPIYYWLWLSDRQMDTLMHEDRWKEEEEKRSKEPNGGAVWWTDKGETERRKKMMHVRGHTGAFPPIGGLYLRYRVTHTHTHTHTLHLHMETEIGLLIASRQTDLEGQERSLQRVTCLVIVSANRKTIGDLNSGTIKSGLTSVTVIQVSRAALQVDINCFLFFLIAFSLR